ncbi:MAG: STAS domain-containing protein [Armatimonadetes bacterium]|nr:STAS domain-containing protein [Armatimonadota bacterium]
METTIYSPEEHPGVTVIATAGDIDLGEAGGDRLISLLHGLVESGERFLIFDLSGSERVAGRALAEMTGVLALVRLKGGDAVFVVRPGPVLRDLQTIGLPKLTLVLEYLDQAVEQMGMKAGEADD